MTLIDQPSVDNGVNVQALLDARAALTDAPEAAAFQWRAQSQWVAGTHTRTTVHAFFGLGAEQSHREAFVVDTDHPEVFASQDKGMTPVEMVLAGLAGWNRGGHSCFGFSSHEPRRGEAPTEPPFVRQPDPTLGAGRHFVSYLDRDLSNATKCPQRPSGVSSRHFGVHRRGTSNAGAGSLLGTPERARLRS
jgi:hypothetical protein